MLINKVNVGCNGEKEREGVASTTKIKSILLEIEVFS